MFRGAQNKKNTRLNSLEPYDWLFTDNIKANSFPHPATEDTGNMTRKVLYPFFIVMALGFFLDGLDGTIVTIALPTIGSAFGIDAATSSWIVTIYFLSMAGLILIMGRLAGCGHLKSMLIIGFVTFAIGSLFCGLSWSLPMMLVFRVVQGIGGAMLAAGAALAPLRYLPPGKLSMGLAVTLLGSSLGAASGPAIGGIITDLISWNWIFYINVPIGLIAAYYSFKVLPKDIEAVKGRFDISGSVLLFAALICGLYTVESLPSHGLSSVTAATIAVFISAFMLFVLIERRKNDPVLDLSLFKLWKFDCVTLAYIIVNMVYAGVIYITPFYLTIVSGYSTLWSGIIMLIPAVATCIFCLPVSRSAGIRGNRVYALISMCMVVLSSAVLFFVQPYISIIMLIIGLVLLGLIWGFGSGSLSARMLDAAPSDQKDRASSIFSFLIYFGSALGTALYSGLFSFASSSGGIPISEILVTDFLTGFHAVMAVGILLGVIALVASYIVKEY